ncbi:MAG TPA: M23 family metallopeptidase [Micromonosporaceae bacterium]|nr:M23 family metallopeptidase [Micromonosporaceae bacterium]
MRQRLSSEPDRYRGRRRVPTPPRSRYAAVVTSAFVGAGVVALGAAAALPDAKAASPSALADLDQTALNEAAAERAAEADRTTSRDHDRSDSLEVEEQDLWVLPMKDYTFTSPYGVRWGELHAGIDLAAPEGTPYHAIHAGTVTKAGWYGGYGYCVIVRHADGIESIYGHSAKLMVEEGQEVKAGDVLGLVGNSGHSYGPQLHLEVHVKGEPRDPVPFLRERDVDIKLKLDPIFGGVSSS